jgi:ribonuclease R
MLKEKKGDFMKKQTADFPTMKELVEFLNQSEQSSSKRQIAKAFGIKGEEKRVQLKKALKELKEKGVVESKGGRLFASGSFGDRCRVEITGQDSKGRFIGRPVEGQEKGLQATGIVSSSVSSSDGRSVLQVVLKPSNLRPALKIGDIVIVKLISAPKESLFLQGEVLKRLSVQNHRMVGVYVDGKVQSVDRRLHQEFYLEGAGKEDIKSGDVLLVDIPTFIKKGTKARFLEKIGSATDSNVFSLISVYAHHLPYLFKQKAVKEAEKMSVPPLEKREDLRDVPFVTIDGEDARDFDDAVFAEFLPNEGKNGKWRVLVAIADVSFYVRSGSVLDTEAFERGNSVYFPDRVVPMLPEGLSDNICSLLPKQDRAVLVCEVILDTKGNKESYRFFRALIRSQGRLTYRQVQESFDKKAPVEGLEDQMAALLAVYTLLDKQRGRRGVLELDIPELIIRLDENKKVSSIEQRERLTSHKVIEELMILANVSAAQALGEKNASVMYRVHEAPSDEKLALFKERMESLGKHFSQIGDEPAAKDFALLLKNEKAKEKEKNKKDISFLISEIVLRSQSQAFYSPHNLGHFGLALKKYAHFTSPIRRYADILVHRSLVKAFSLGEGGLSVEEENAFDKIAEHISQTEREAMAAERETEERYLSSFLKQQEGEVFSGIVAGVSAFGVFVRLEPTLAEGFVPMSLLGRQYFTYDESGMRVYSDDGLSYQIGQKVKVILKESVPVTGGLLLQMLDDDGHPLGRPEKRHPMKTQKDRLKKKKDKLRREKDSAEKFSIDRKKSEKRGKKRKKKR